MRKRCLFCLLPSHAIPTTTTTTAMRTTTTTTTTATADRDDEKIHRKRLSRVQVLSYVLGIAVVTFVLLASVHRTVWSLFRPAAATADNISLDTVPVVSTTTIDRQQSPSTSTVSTKLISKAQNAQSTIALTTNGAQTQTTTFATKVTTTTTSTASPPRSDLVRPSPGPLPNSLIHSSIRCPDIKRAQYASLANAESSLLNLKWCKDTQNRHGVRIGRSWGSLSGDNRRAWEDKRCNELLALGTVQSCSQRWGWDWFTYWMNSSVPIFQGGSEVSCGVDVKTTTFCQMKEVVVDFGKMAVRDGSREFQSGFVTMFGSPTRHFGKLPAYPGVKHVSSVTPPSVSAGSCDRVESRPTFVLSNDDIFNLGHYMNDVMGIWNMMTLSNQIPKNSLLINIDGVRAGGPAGGPPHRLMLARSPDDHGPYSPYYYHQWFNEVQKGIEMKHQRVCFKNLYLFPLPGVPWFWNNWSRLDECSVQSSSPLYQSFNVHLRQHLLDGLGSHSLPNPPLDYVHVVIEVRKINPRKSNAHSSARYIANLPELVAALKAIPNVRVTAQDFAQLSFLEQIKLAHSASILISMHGAGTTHIFHMAIGQRNCCGLVELFPDTSTDLYTAYGYGNLARMLGLHHMRYVAEKGSTQSSGTTVNVRKVTEMVQEMSKDVYQDPTCLFDVKDTRNPLFRDKDPFSTSFAL
jgi:hypothetical protein